MQPLIPVLGIDDDLEDTQLITEALEKADVHEYHFFSESGEFFAVYNDQFRVIIIDYHLPGMNGQAVIDKVKKICPAVRPIAISGLITPEMHLRLQISGAKDFVVKRGSNWADELAIKVKEQLALAYEDIQDEQRIRAENQRGLSEVKQLLKR